MHAQLGPIDAQRELNQPLGSNACPACGGSFAQMDGPTHPYMLSSPGCWNAYGTLLAREYSDPDLFASAHRLTVDAYALQHPGDPNDRRALQSVWVHYAALHLAFVDRRPLASIASAMQQLAGLAYPQLPPAPSRFGLTLADVLARPADDHVTAVHAWASCAFDAWIALREPTIDILRAV